MVSFRSNQTSHALLMSGLEEQWWFVALASYAVNLSTQCIKILSIYRYEKGSL